MKIKTNKKYKIIESWKLNFWQNWH